METRLDAIRFISYHITNGKGVKIHIDGCDLRLQIADGYMIWHNETTKDIAAIIHDESECNLDVSSDWAKSELENY